jgi:hypothetical protein
VAAAFQAEKARKEAADNIASCYALILSSPLLKDFNSDQAVAKGLAYEVVMGEALASAAPRLEPEARHHVASTATMLTTATTKKSHPLNASSRKCIRSTNAKHGTRSFNQWRKRQVDVIVNFLISLFGIGWHKEFGNVALQADKRISASHDDISANPAHIVDVFDSFFKTYQRLFDAVGEPTKRRGRNIAALGKHYLAR